MFWASKHETSGLSETCGPKSSRRLEPCSRSQRLNLFLLPSASKILKKSLRKLSDKMINNIFLDVQTSFFGRPQNCFLDVQFFFGRSKNCWTSNFFVWTSKKLFGTSKIWTSKRFFGHPKNFLDVQKMF